MKNNGYYNEKVIAKFAAALKEAVQAVKAGEITKVSISAKNNKMGDVASVSLMPFLSCPGRCADTCGGKCYAAKLANLRKNVLTSYARNQALAIYAPDLYWKQVNAAISAVRFFRFHVSGDILHYAYFEKMVECARMNPKTEILAFTKRYEIVNAWIEANGDLPENLHILFSGWNNLAPENPHNMPETNVFAHDGEAKETWRVCGGNCFQCALNCEGCWNAKRGDTIAFKLH